MKHFGEGPSSDQSPLKCANATRIGWFWCQSWQCSSEFWVHFNKVYFISKKDDTLSCENDRLSRRPCACLAPEDSACVIKPPNNLRAEVTSVVHMWIHVYAKSCSPEKLVLGHCITWSCNYNFHLQAVFLQFTLHDLNLIAHNVE